MKEQQLPQPLEDSSTGNAPLGKIISSHLCLRNSSSHTPNYTLDQQVSEHRPAGKLSILLQAGESHAEEKKKGTVSLSFGLQRPF